MYVKTVSPTIDPVHACCNPLVYIVVVNWNQPQLTTDCLRSLRTLVYPNYRVLVVDNGSQDDSAEKLRAEFGDWIDVIANETNLGFAGGNNAGIRYALQQAADYVLLLNNDTLVHDLNLLSTLVTVFCDNDRIGLACPTIWYADRSEQPWYAGARFSMWRGGGSHLQRPPTGNQAVDTGYATGCCVMASRCFIEEVGLLDEAFFLYQEDVDWSIRAKRAEFRVVHVPDAHLVHRVSASTKALSGQGTYSPSTVYYKSRNRILLVRKHGNLCQKYFVWPAFDLVDVLIHAVAYLSLGRPQKLKAMLNGIRDGLTGEAGVWIES